MLVMTGVHKLEIMQTIKLVNTDISVLKTLETTVMRTGIIMTISTQTWEIATDTKSFGDWV